MDSSAKPDVVLGRILLPLEIGKNVLTGWEGKVIRNEKPYIKLLTNPVYRNQRWEAVAQVDTMLCWIEVTPVAKEEQ